MRTMGATRNCAGCRFWSEMIARAGGGTTNPRGDTEALCLAADGPHASKYTTEGMTCGSWKSGHLGAVDDPPNYGEQTRAAYEAEEGSDAFKLFKAGDPARSMFRKLGLLEYLEAAQSWRSLRALIVKFNDCDKGNFVALARRCDGVSSSGERILLHAICYVTDFAWLADELGGADEHGSKVWRNMDRASGEWRQAVAACIGAEV
jgi:hypothetical protein